MENIFTTNQFKAITVKDNQWVTGDLTRIIRHLPDGTKDVAFYINSNDIWVDEKGFSMCQSGMNIKVDAKTICQFTGIYDGTPWEANEKNGKSNLIRLGGLGLPQMV